MEQLTGETLEWVVSAVNSAESRGVIKRKQW